METLISKKAVKTVLLLIGVFLLLFTYKTYSPYGNVFFPKCLIKEATGFDCAGCGSQRAIHSLLNLNFKQAIQENALLVLSIPYILIGFILKSIKKASPTQLKWRKMLYGQPAIYLVLFLIIVFVIYRNI